MKYSYIIDQQPIGRLLFLQFCEEERQEFHRYNVFLNSIVSYKKRQITFYTIIIFMKFVCLISCQQEKYEIESDENRLGLAKILYDRFIRIGVRIYISVDFCLFSKKLLLINCLK